MPRRTFKISSTSLNILRQDKGKLSIYVVVTFFLLFCGLVFNQFFLSESSKLGFKEEYELDPSVWETPKPLGQMSRGIKMEKNIVDGKNFRKKILSKQVEMKQLIRDISASMSRNPVVQQILASRQHFKYNENNTLKVDPSLEEHTGWDGIWQPVNGSSHKFYVYSAFYDNRDKPMIRVISATKTKNYDKVWCKLYYRDRQPILVPAGVNAIRENWNLKYSAAFLTCLLPNQTKQPNSEPNQTNQQESPVSLSIVAKLNLPASNQLSINYHKTGIVGANNSKIGVCVKPVHFMYNKTFQFIQFIELNRLLGVTRFILYNSSMSAEIACIISDYVKQGIVQLLPWNLNMQSQKEIRTEGLFAALNDCLYRSMNSFSYLMLIDFDEFIIPHQETSLPDMISSLSKRVFVQSGKPISASQVSSYSFQNSFFYLQWMDDSSISVNPQLTTLAKTKRKQKFHPPKQRSKYICIPSAVKEVGNHFIWEFHHGRTLNVPTSIGFLHHYRVCEFGGDDCINNGFIEDTRIPSTWGQQLVQNVDRISQETNCDL